LKHCSRPNAEALVAAEPGGVARRFLDGHAPSLEAQLCNLADEIAYNAHDVDDGVRSGLITLEQVASVPLFDRFMRQALTAHPTLKGRRLLFESIRLMLSAQVYDVIAATQTAIAQSGVQTPAEAARAGLLVRFSAEMRAESTALKRFLFQNLYRHPQVESTMDRARTVVTDLFVLYVADTPAQLAQRPGDSRQRAVADYIAGMTDRFALSAHRQLTGQTLFD
jgi:dGTPase